MTTNADRDRERIAELRRVAREAQGRNPDEAEPRENGPSSRWQPDAGMRFVEVGPGIQALTLEEASRRLKLSTREVLAKVDARQLVGRMGVIPVAEVERLEAGQTPM